MTYIKIDKNTFIQYIPEKPPIVIKKDELERKVSTLESSLAELNDFSDEKLLVWAKSNYPNQTRMIEVTNGHLEEASKDLEEINKL